MAPSTGAGVGEIERDQADQFGAPAAAIRHVRWISWYGAVGDDLEVRGVTRAKQASDWPNARTRQRSAKPSGNRRRKGFPELGLQPHSKD